MTEESNRLTPAELRAGAMTSREQKLAGIIEDTWDLLKEASIDGKTEVYPSSMFDRREYEDVEIHHQAIFDHFEKAGFAVSGDNFDFLKISFAEGEN